MSETRYGKCVFDMQYEFYLQLKLLFEAFCAALNIQRATLEMLSDLSCKGSVTDVQF